MNRISDLFEVFYGVNLEYNKMIPHESGVPFVARGSGNNGVVGYVRRIDGIKPNPSNTISVAGGGSVLESYLQEEPYYSGRDLYYLKPKKPLSKNTLLFYCLVLRSNKYRFSYGRQANRTLGDLLIPSVDEIPSWVEETVIPKKPNPNSINNSTIDFSDRRWEWFELQKLFKLKKGKRLTADNFISGDTPFIGAIDNNNGYREFIGQRPIHYGNTITVNYNGSVGEAFYQTDPFWASDDVNVLYPKFNMNVFSALFICTIIKQEKYRYSFGRKWHLDRMKISTIYLPVTKEGNPDWQFMEDYIKSLPYSINLKDKKEKEKKPDKGLSDSELIEKYESGSIDLGGQLKKTFADEK